MLDSGGHEQKVAGLEWVPLAIVKQNASAANDDVNLVLCVRRLFIRARGRREFYVGAAASQKADGALAVGTRDAHLSFRETDHAAAVRFDHASLLVLPNAHAERPARTARDDHGTSADHSQPVKVVLIAFGCLLASWIVLILLAARLRRGS
jgi:hypothetical protein